MKEYIECIRKCGVLKGRSRRREYWMFVLFNFLVSVVVYFALAFGGELLGMQPFAKVMGQAYNFAVMAVGVSVATRRLHDIGKSGWWQLIGLVPVIGWIVLLVYFCRDSQPGENAYGPNPKE